MMLILPVFPLAAEAFAAYAVEGRSNDNAAVQKKAASMREI
jgi:hypothetical protein